MRLKAFATALMLGCAFVTLASVIYPRRLLSHNPSTIANTVDDDQDHSASTVEYEVVPDRKATAEETTDWRNEDEEPVEWEYIDLGTPTPQPGQDNGPTPGDGETPTVESPPDGGTTPSEPPSSPAPPESDGSGVILSCTIESSALADILHKLDALKPFFSDANVIVTSWDVLCDDLKTVTSNSDETSSIPPAIMGDILNMLEPMHEPARKRAALRKRSVDVSGDNALRALRNLVGGNDECAEVAKVLADLLESLMVFLDDDTDLPAAAGAPPVGRTPNVAEHPGAADSPGTAADPNAADRPGVVDTPSTAGDSGTVDGPGTVSRPHTVNGPGTVDDSSTIDGPSTVEEPGTVDEADKAGSPDTGIDPGTVDGSNTVDGPDAVDTGKSGGSTKTFDMPDPPVKPSLTIVYDGTVTELADKQPSPAVIPDGTQTTDSPQRPTFINSPPVATLHPTVHWSVNTNLFENIVPIEAHKGSELYFGISNPSESGQFAVIKYNFVSPSVNINHTSHITLEFSSEQGIVASFSSQQAFDHAYRTWTLWGGLILIAPGCREAAATDLCYFNVTTLHFYFEKLQIVGEGNLTLPDYVISSAETHWGYWNAPSTNSSAAEADSTPPGNIEWRRGTLDLECQAPADTVHGLPTACPGSHFDQALDDKAGYRKLSSTEKAFLDGLNLPQGSYSAHATFNGTDLIGFGWDDVVDAWDSATTIDLSGKRTWPFALPERRSVEGTASTLTGINTAEVDSPWGKAILLESFGSETEKNGVIEYLKVYCVGCGASGKATIAGHLKWKPFHLETARVELNLDMILSLKVGVEAQASMKKTVNMDLFSYGLPGLSFGVVTIGPYVDLGARLTFEANAHGQVLAGAGMGLQNAAVVLDFVDSQTVKQSGWQPIVKPVFEAKGEVDVSAELGLPIGIKCGIKMSDLWEQSFGIINEPSIKATAEVAAHTQDDASRKTKRGIVPSNDCNGINTAATWRNKVSVEIKDVVDKTILDTGDLTLYKRCIGTESKGASTRRVKRAASRKVKRSSQVRSEETNPANSTAQLGNAGPTEVTYRSGPIAPELDDDVVDRELQLLTSPSGDTKVISCTKGNVYAVRDDGKSNPLCFDEWTTNPRASGVVADGHGRALHYYNGTMAEHGVSRLRVSPIDRLPEDSVTVVLAPTGAVPGSYNALSSELKLFQLVFCNYTNVPESKVFLAKNAVEGSKTLLSKEVKFTVTGGDVAQCHPLRVNPA